jgi:hypothetical protein
MINLGLAANGSIAGILAAAIVISGCGSEPKSRREGNAEVASVIELLKSSKPGEMIISASQSPLIDGPYRFKPGGYVFRFRQESRGRLIVALESKPRSRRPPYQRLIDTFDRSGRTQVQMAGKLYVHVVSDGAYLLRFTPKLGS